jgi:hypothetical protein
MKVWQRIVTGANGILKASQKGLNTLEHVGSTRKEYYDAITAALDVVITLNDRHHSTGVKAFFRVLAWVWDATNVNAKCLDFQVMDATLRDIAVRLLIGRLDHGRPIDHDRVEEIEEHYSLQVTD